MTEWAIVAVPKKDDYVWKISSEKIPHMTILYLGEQGDKTPSESLVGFLQHVCDMMLMRFGASVSSRGTLGTDNADVVLFEKNWLRELGKARTAMLQNDEIRRMYDSTEQYPEWTPHLTLGYPAKPAKPDTREYPGITYVDFDSLFLWTSDSDGIMFPLKGWSDVHDSPEIMQAAQLGEEFLAHYGVKGMRWGVRRQRDGSTVGTPRAKSQDHLDAAAAQAKVKKEGLAALSNHELQKLNNRMQLEQTYSQLISKQGDVITKGNNKAKKILSVGKTAQEAYNLATSPAGKAAAAFIAGALKK